MKPDSAIEIVRKLRDRGHEAYLVGGCVRDMVMKLEPADYDIATNAPPEAVMKIFPHTQAIGVQFGVVLVIHRGHPYEVATFRSDEAYVDGRRPTGVVFTDARSDVLRRDFTINGLLYDPIENRVLDYVSGQDDIQRRIVRAIGDPRKRFAEDKLRLLRAVRFAARFEYVIEEQTWDALREMAPQIQQVSAERISSEVQRILTEGHAARGFRLLHDSGLMRAIFPEILLDTHLEDCLFALPAGSMPDFALAVLLHETPRPLAAAVLERLRLSNAQAAHACSLIESLPFFRDAGERPVHALKRFLRKPRIEDHLELERLCAVSSGRGLANYNFVLEKRQSWSDTDITPAALISGDDLIEMGFSPGILFKEILTRVEDEQLEGRLTTRKQARDFVESHYRAM